MAEFESCDKCKYKSRLLCEEPCRQCTHGVNTKNFFEPISNADKIRAMSDEELAEFFARRCPCDFYCSYANKSCNGISCKQGILEWLKSEAKE